MSKLLTLAVWCIRQAFKVDADQWAAVKEWVNEAESLTNKTGAEKRAFVRDTLSEVFTSQLVLNLLIELAVALLRKATA